jgi:hypothetical protein
MDVIGVLYVSLGSSTAQLHDSQRSRRACPFSDAGFSSQIGDRASGVYCRRAAFCCAIFVGKRNQCKNIHIEIFTVYVWKVFVV